MVSQEFYDLVQSEWSPGQGRYSILFGRRGFYVVVLCKPAFVSARDHALYQNSSMSIESLHFASGSSEVSIERPCLRKLAEQRNLIDYHQLQLSSTLALQRRSPIQGHSRGCSHIICSSLVLVLCLSFPVSDLS